MSRFVKLAGLFGLSIALLLSTTWWIHNSGKALQFGPTTSRGLAKITMLLWPSSIFLMATENSSVLFSLFVSLLAVLLNALLYMLVAYVVGKVYHALV
ncbi:MAG TPA: hypothetical protein VI431_04445 [Candidatus Acidoferrum sp.]